MPVAENIVAIETGLLPGLLTLTGEALVAADELLAKAKSRVRDRVSEGDRISGRLMDVEQIAAHGLAWLATYVEALREMHGWAARLETEDKLGALEQLILQAAFGEYLWQIHGGIPMNQGEIVRPQDLGLSRDDQRALMVPAVQTLTQSGNSAAVRLEIAQLMEQRGSFGDPGDDGDMGLIRDQFRRFADDKVAPFAHDWHLKNDYIPMELIGEMVELGVFGLTIPESHGGFGMGKMAMCVVSEELCRGYIGVGSLGTRSEIAAELIMGGGTEEQKQRWLPKIASGELLPTAVFTEPNTGSDLGALRTRAVLDGGTYKITGNKTWITHPVRADIMTLMARTDPDTENYKGLSMFIAEKPRGTDEDPFPRPACPAARSMCSATAA